MPEGDTIFRTAETLRRWVGGREITAARSRAYGFPALRLVGRTVDGVEARGKHLLLRLDDGTVLHTHLRMSGSWHVYPADRPWRRPESQARLVLECGDRVAVCFNAPTVELLHARAEGAHPSLGRLGPDVLSDDVDLEEVRRRARTRPPELALGESVACLLVGFGELAGQAADRTAAGGVAGVLNLHQIVEPPGDGGPG